jgi:hypothetical protein
MDIDFSDEDPAYGASGCVGTHFHNQGIYDGI